MTALRGALARLSAWAGTDRLAMVRARRDELAARPITPAAAPLALFVAGVDVPAAQIPDLEWLAARELVTVSAGVAHANVAILPLGPSLIVCDRPERDAHDSVCWPDDSSEHVARALPPGRRDRWLDLCCGSAYAPLARPELARAIVGVDLNARAVRFAGLGAELSGVAHVAAEIGDLAVPAALAGRCDLVTCNAPIPGLAAPLWYATDDATFFDRMLAAARTAAAPGALVVVHAAADAMLPQLASLPGERAVVAYTPPEIRPFCVLWWRPDGPDRIASTRRELSTDRPHVDHADYVLASTAAWGGSLRSS